MAMVRIVPSEDWAVLKRYLDCAGLVLVPQPVLDQLDPVTADNVREKDGTEVEYGFGGEPGCCLDVVLNEASYAAQELFVRHAVIAGDGEPVTIVRTAGPDPVSGEQRWIVRDFDRRESTLCESELRYL